MYCKIRKLFRWFSTAGKISILLIGIVFFIAIFAPWISIHKHNHSSGPPLSPPVKEHILGTDELGVDLFAQICLGARISLIIGIGPAFLSGI